MFIHFEIKTMDFRTDSETYEKKQPFSDEFVKSLQNVYLFILKF